MPRAHNGHVEIEYRTFGDGQPETILLVNGLGSQMTRWPEAFCERLASRGFRVIRYDNRDTGLSTWFGDEDRYVLADMARDGIAVLDAAGVPCAPVQDVGAMLRHPQTEALGMLQRVPGSSIPLIGLPIRFDGARPQPRSAPPSLGSSDLKSLLAQRRHEA